MHPTDYRSPSYHVENVITLWPTRRPEALNHVSDASRMPADPLAPIRTLPVDFDPVLYDCSFGVSDKHDSRSGVQVMDSSGKTIGTGKDFEQACWFAAKVSKASMLQPSNYYPALIDCTFKVDANHGVASYLVVKTGTGQKNTDRVLSRGYNKSEACLAANLGLLREKNTSDLSLDEFSQLCVVVTAVAFTPKQSGKNKSDVRLRADPSAKHSGMDDLIKAVTAESHATDVGPNDRVYWRDQRLAQILSSNMHNGDMEHIALEGGQHVILRTHESQPALQCLTEVHHRLTHPDEEEVESEPKFLRPRGN